MHKLLISLLILALSFINLYLPKGDRLRRTDIKKIANTVSQLDQKVATNEAGFHTVVKVIDGDTIEIDTHEKVRYIGIDTPELHHPKKKIECYAIEAFKKNQELILNKRVKLIKDISNKDRYGRLLRYVYLINNQNVETFVNAKLIEEGFAYVVTYPPDVAYSQYFLKLQLQARERKLGLWRQCSYE